MLDIILPIFESYVALIPVTLAQSLILSFVVATKGSYQWDMVLRYLHWDPVGSTDPVFNKDVGFYLFTLPLYLYIRYGLLVLFVLVIGHRHGRR